MCTKERHPHNTQGDFVAPKASPAIKAPKFSVDDKLGASSTLVELLDAQNKELADHIDVLKQRQGAKKPHA